MITDYKKVRWIKLVMRFIPGGIQRAKYLKRRNVFFEMGDNCFWHSDDIPSEPWLVKIHNNVKVSANVRFITHDIISNVINQMPEYTQFNLCRFFRGTIEIMDNVMVGANSTVLYNVKIGPNAIVVAGSVVTKDVPEGVIVGGNPARIIGSFDDLAKKRITLSRDIPSNDDLDEIIKYFWEK